MQWSCGWKVGEPPEVNSAVRQVQERDRKRPAILNGGSKIGRAKHTSGRAPLILKQGWHAWAHWFDESADRVRYLVVPFSPSLLDRLERGQISIRDALDQPRLWVVDVDNQGVPITASRTTLAHLPAEELPVDGTMLVRG
jgi:hypothetical protein